MLFSLYGSSLCIFLVVTDVQICQIILMTFHWLKTLQVDKQGAYQSKK